MLLVCCSYITEHQTVVNVTLVHKICIWYMLGIQYYIYVIFNNIKTVCSYFKYPNYLCVCPLNCVRIRIDSLFLSALIA